MPMKGEEFMTAITIRMPEELLEKLRVAAARETIKQKKQVSMNTLAVEILTKGLEEKKKRAN